MFSYYNLFWFNQNSRPISICIFTYKWTFEWEHGIKKRFDMFVLFCHYIYCKFFVFRFSKRNIPVSRFERANGSMTWNPIYLFPLSTQLAALPIICLMVSFAIEIPNIAAFTNCLVITSSSQSDNTVLRSVLSSHLTGHLPVSCIQSWSLDSFIEQLTYMPHS